MVYAGGWQGRDNLGDEALFIAYRTLFENYGFLSYRKPSGVLKMVHSMSRPAQVAVLAGGTLINRGGTSLAVLRECLDVCKDGFIFGSGVADPAFWNGRPNWRDDLKAWKPVLERCRYVGVRGPRSREILQDNGVEAEVIGDPVIALTDPAAPANGDRAPASLGLNLGHSFGHLWGDEDSIKREFSKVAKCARHAGWKVRWFVVWPSDREITLQAARDSETDAEVLEVYDDPKAFMDLVRSSTVFVGMKLHAVVLATCAYVPSLMVEYRPKCRDYMQSIDQDAWTVRADHFRSDDVWDRVTDLSARRETCSRDLSERIGRLRGRQLTKAAELTRLFGGRR
jgi:polysaccharide pyruvyl transferase WcaK-like protein